MNILWHIQHNGIHHFHIFGGIHNMITTIFAIIHLVSFWLLWALNSYILYTKYSKFWLFKAFAFAFFCSFFGTLFALFLCKDNSEGKPERLVKDIINNPKLLIQ